MMIIRKNWLLVLMLLVTLSAGMTMLACGDDDDDDDDDVVADDDAADDDATDDDEVDDDTTDDDVIDDDTSDDDTADDDTADDDATDDDEAPPTDLISINVYDILTGSSISGVTCELIKSSDGTSFDPAITTTSDGSGFCTFNNSMEKGNYSVKFTKTGYVDTYAFNYMSEMTLYFAMATPAGRTLIALAAGVTVQSGKGIISGSVQWLDGTNLEYVGCAEVSDTGSNEYIYFDENVMPDPLRTNTHPDNGYFIAFNADNEALTLTADADGDTTTAALPVVNADSLTYANVLYTGGSNPTPGGCTK